MRPGARPRRRGFTLVEMGVAVLLMALLASVLGNAWAAFGRPAITTVARCRVAQEANLAAEALAHDVGHLARPASTEPDTRYQNAQGGGATLYLTVDDGTGPPRTITYAPSPSDPSKLLRTDLSATAGTGRVVAGLLGGFDAQAATLPLGPGGSEVSGVQIDLTFTHRTIDRNPDGTSCVQYARRYTLFVPDPQPLGSP